MESKLQTKIIKHLEREGWEVVKTILLNKSGYEDLFCFKNGKTMFIEVKDKGKKPTDLQLYRIKKHNENGFISFWVDDFLTFINIINNHKDLSL